MSSCSFVRGSICGLNDNRNVDDNSKFKLLKIVDATSVSASAILFDMLQEKDASITQQPKIADDITVMDIGVVMIMGLYIVMLQMWYTGELGLLYESHRTEIEHVKDQVKLNLTTARTAVSTASTLLRNQFS